MFLTVPYLRVVIIDEGMDLGKILENSHKSFWWKKRKREKNRPFYLSSLSHLSSDELTFLFNWHILVNIVWNFDTWRLNFFIIVKYWEYLLNISFVTTTINRNRVLLSEISSPVAMHAGLATSPV